MREFREIIHYECVGFASPLSPSVYALCMRCRVKLRLLFIFLALSFTFFFFLLTGVLDGIPVSVQEVYR